MKNSLRIDTIALDLSSNIIKMVSGRRIQDKILISNFGSIRAYSSLSTPDLSSISNGIKKLLVDRGFEPSKFKNINAHCVISGAKLCIRLVKLPAMSKDEVHQAVKAKIKEFVSYPLEEMIYDFSILGETQERGIDKLAVVFIAIQKKDFNEYLEIFKNINIVPNVITASSFSCLNLIKYAKLIETSSLIMMGIEDTQTDISVFRKDKLAFTRNVSFGCFNFIKALQEGLKLSQEAAQDIIFKYGLSIESLPDKSNINLERVKDVLTNQADILYRECDLTSHHYYQITHGEAIDKYLLLGEGAKIKGLDNFFAKKLDVRVEEFKIPDNMIDVLPGKENEFKQNVLSYYQCIGALIADPVDINLASFINRRVKGGFRLPRVSFSPSIVNIVPLVVLGLVALSFISVKAQAFYYRQKINANNEKYKSMEDKLFKAASLKRKIDNIVFKKDFYEQLIKNNPSFPEAISKICSSIPEGKIILDGLSFSKNEDQEVDFTIRGRAMDTAFYSPTDFMLELEGTKYFNNMSISSGTGRYEESAQPSGAQAFTIIGKVKKEQ